jgi:hypothetical protein
MTHVDGDCIGATALVTIFPFKQEAQTRDRSFVGTHAYPPLFEFMKKRCGLFDRWSRH